MPCPPGEVTVIRYLAIGRLGRAEREEAAVRLVYACQVRGDWVPISWRELFNEQLAPEVAQLALQKFEAEYERSLATYWHRVYASLGLLRLFQSPPARPLMTSGGVEPATYEFQSLLHLGLDQGIQMVAEGLRELEAVGLIRHDVRDGNRHNSAGDNHCFQVLPELVERLIA